jgi:subtilisin family serine protease
MKHVYLLTIVFLLVALSTKAQDARYTVKFKYKPSDGYSLAEPLGFLTQKAIDRRKKQKIKIDSTDLPINSGYLDAIRNVPGVTILNTSKWFNQALVETTDPNAIATINGMPFVAHSKPVAAVIKSTENIAAMNDCSTAQEPAGPAKVAANLLDYGNNYQQVHIHEGEYLHNNNFQGQGVTIAVLDGGFYGYKTNRALDSVRNNHQVLGEYDFVKKETSVDEDNVHGANCFSIMASNRPGYIVGTAPKASYWLFRTEDVGSEKPVEEFNWVEAAERADSLGADMISSSLGYVNFDDPVYNHTLEDRDGNTSLITNGADMAVKKGMIVVNAAGNSGNASDDTKYVMCPADGDSVFTIGAVDNTGNIGWFSSWGPNAAGKLKPNVVSVGASAVYANTAGDPSTGSGTSYATPNLAGLVACLWQAFYEFSNMEIMDAVQKSADRYNNPDERYGYGIPNFRVAYSLLDAKRTEKTNAILNGRWIAAFPVPYRQSFTVMLKAPSSGMANLRVFDATGNMLLEKSMLVNQGSNYTIPMNLSSSHHRGIFYLQYADGKNATTLKLISL